jgi:hypothetical protein
MTPAQLRSARTRRRLFAALLIVDGIVTLCPPLYWAAGSSGSRPLTLGYFLGGSLIVLVSLLVMSRIDSASDRGSDTDVAS